jgi:hypothetical protein
MSLALVMRDRLGNILFLASSTLSNLVRAGPAAVGKVATMGLATSLWQ